MEWRDDKAKQGRKTLQVRVASLPEHPDRFWVYAGSSFLTTMWVLWDKVIGSQHYLYAVDLPDACRVAEERIPGILNPPPSVPRKPRKKRKTHE